VVQAYGPRLQHPIASPACRDDLRYCEVLRKPGVIVVRHAGARDARLVFDQRTVRALDEHALDSQQVREMRGDRPRLAGGRVAELLFAQPGDEAEEPLAASLQIGSQ
jgi:hypothetical protein